MLLVPYFREKALLVFVSKEYYPIAFGCPEFSLLLKLLFAAYVRDAILVRLMTCHRPVSMSCIVH